MMYIITLLIVLLILILLFTGQVRYKFNTEQIKLYATYWFPYTIKLEDIDSIKVLDQLKFGIRLCGLGSFKCAAGLFRNKAYGNYILYTDNYLGQHIELRLKSRKIVVFSIKSQNILELYSTLQRRIK